MNHSFSDIIYEQSQSRAVSRQIDAILNDERAEQLLEFLAKARLAARNFNQRLMYMNAEAIDRHADLSVLLEKCARIIEDWEFYSLLTTDNSALQQGVNNEYRLTGQSSPSDEPESHEVTILEADEDTA